MQTTQTVHDKQIDLQRDIYLVKHDIGILQAKIDTATQSVNKTYDNYTNHISYIHNRLDTLTNAIMEIRDMARDKTKNA